MEARTKESIFIAFFLLPLGNAMQEELKQGNHGIFKTLFVEF